MMVAETGKCCESRTHSDRKCEYEADVIVVGFGGAGGCAAVEAHDAGAEVLVLEKQPEERHYSNTRMSGGTYHSPDPEGDRAALKEYAKAMISGDNLPWKLEGEQPEFSEELADVWAEYSPQNKEFMRSLDSDYKTIRVGGAAYPFFPGAAGSKYALVRSTYTGDTGDEHFTKSTRDLPRSVKEDGDAFHACLVNGIKTRGIRVHYDSRARSLIVNKGGEVIGVKAQQGKRLVTYTARRAVIITSGGYEYNKHMRKAFLEGPGVEGWAFYGSADNTGDGIEMAMKIGAGLSKIGNISGRIICAIPVRRHGLKIGVNTSAAGKPNGIVVDSYGNRYAAERRITKDPSCYIFYKEALIFDTVNLLYPRIPSWMIFDEALRERGPLISVRAASYHSIDWGNDNLNAIKEGWVLKESSIEDLAEKIKQHPDNRKLMNAETLVRNVNRYNQFCLTGKDLDFSREPGTLGPVEKPPFYAMPLYPGGPNTKGGLIANAKRQVLTWEYKPIPRLYTAGEISSAFKFVYQGGGNVAECITFGRVAGKNAALERPWIQR